MSFQNFVFSKFRFKRRKFEALFWYVAKLQTTSNETFFNNFCQKEKISNFIVLLISELLNESSKNEIVTKKLSNPLLKMCLQKNKPNKSQIVFSLRKSEQLKLAIWLVRSCADFLWKSLFLIYSFLFCSVLCYTPTRLLKGIIFSYKDSES